MARAAETATPAATATPSISPAEARTTVEHDYELFLKGDYRSSDVPATSAAIALLDVGTATKIRARASLEQWAKARDAANKALSDAALAGADYAAGRGSEEMVNLRQKFFDSRNQESKDASKEVKEAFVALFDANDAALKAAAAKPTPPAKKAAKHSK